MAHGYGPPSRPVEETLLALRDGLMHEYRADYLPAHRRSPRKMRRLRRIRGWTRETGQLLSQIDRVMREILPRIEQDTGHTFRDPDGLARVLMDPSTKRLFRGILAGFPEGALPVPAKDLALLGTFSDDAPALAIIGDVTLRLKVPSGLHVQGGDLAALCDRWGLHEGRIGFACRRCPAGETLVREKETLAWAVLGLLYIEGDTAALRAVVPLFACGPEM
ncbi:MAG: hypothetical protein CVV31_02855 [Methanomicrobiales archaeon HGW-Methanomicrobiales-2]|jgi:hypothetical protein|nr:MAG: hypothetical protein CVV31_02855 [Methanomicrobiales archaeon HGW-Methanomicrobiales-2]